MKTLDRLDRLVVAPYQGAGVLNQAGLTPQQGESAAWLVLPNGSRYRGAAAFWAALAVIAPIVGDVGLALYHLPLSRPLQDAVYRWISRHRGSFPGDPPFLPTDEEDK